ncbi:MAG: EamA family transporter [Acidobacteriota bacterium]
MIPVALGRKTRVLAAIVILANVFGNFFLSLGLRHSGAGPIVSPHGYLAALANPWVSLGVTILILWMLARLALLSWADLSYVLPITSLGYVLTAMLGRLFLGEQIPAARWAGIALITAGVFLVSRTAIRTAGDRR